MKVGVSVDITAITKQAKAFANLPRDVEAVMVEAAENAAAKEVAGHRYQNRTGRLERSTQASGIFYDGPDQRRIILLMGMPYASFVRERGFTRVAVHADTAAKVMATGFARLERSVG